MWLDTQKGENSTEKTQCLNCQKWGHLARFCKYQTSCQICAENHTTYSHNCNICNINGKEYPHTALKYVNCKENHKANSNICEFSKKQQKYQKYQQKITSKISNSQNNDVIMKDSNSEQQLVGVVIPISNDR